MKLKLKGAEEMTMKEDALKKVSDKVPRCKAATMGFAHYRQQMQKKETEWF